MIKLKINKWHHDVSSSASSSWIVFSASVDCDEKSVVIGSCVTLWKVSEKVVTGMKETIGDDGGGRTVMVLIYVVILFRLSAPLHLWWHLCPYYISAQWCLGFKPPPKQTWYLKHMMVWLTHSQGCMLFADHPNRCLHSYHIYLQGHHESLSPRNSIWKGNPFMVMIEKYP